MSCSCIRGIEGKKLAQDEKYIGDPMYNCIGLQDFIPFYNPQDSEIKTQKR